ncbi:anaphase-promoting complex subunit 4 [Bufo gargarizans]|uniref:anaphase-promoting complex subunit 4 n=1 Tax=Bufo gargarizans TaxID=30331 RepID=UPI001CF107F7|nr:anaphase-promoting complex subunit 4 [Bufo gargarizans]XP_044137797.1 anaphase-promoting complex subunit 4 [Bufo gargarizans]
MPSFRQVGEKQLPHEIIFMSWSPKRDLIALVNKVGEVLLHRLANIQRVWILPPNENTGKEVTCLAWRPDGKILAFGLADTKKVVLCDVEKPESLHSFSVERPVSCMQWMEVTEENSVLKSFYNAEDESSVLLPRLPALPKNYNATAKIFSEEKSDEMKLLGDVRLNALVLGGVSGEIEIYAYGMYKIATIVEVFGSCLGLCLSSDLKSLSVITELKTSTTPVVTYFQLDTSLLSEYLPEVTRMARKFTHISTLLQYIKLSLTCMCEAWEEILMQMDTQLTKFVQEKNTTSSVQDEFMDLLLWGKASPELQELLMNQLTVKGLKKLGQAVESSYSTIQKLVISHLQSGSEALLYHLSELKGMALWKQKYEPLGLDAKAIEDAIMSVGSFSLKANELLQVIDSGMKNFKAFFRWLYVAMLRMSEDHVPPELNKMTQNEITFVADFITEHFDEAPDLYDQKGKYFNVELVGQYLKDEDDILMSPPRTEGNQWFNFLQNSAPLKESPLLFPYYAEKSLHFVKRQMEAVIDQCLAKPADVIGKSVQQKLCIPLYYASESEEPCPRLISLPSLWNDKSQNLHYVLFRMMESSVTKLFIFRQPTDVSRTVNKAFVAVEFGGSLNSSTCENPEPAHYSCLDARFYEDEIVTLVLRDNTEPEGKDRILALLPLSSVYSDEDADYHFIRDPNKRLEEQCADLPSRTVNLESQWRVLENIKAHYVSVNGIRKVASVLSSNLRHVRVFEMDVEDDGEEEEEEGSHSQDVTEEDLDHTTDDAQNNSLEAADVTEESLES